MRKVPSISGYVKISDGARVNLFNKGLVSCDVNQGFLILLFEWEYVSFMMISCIFCYRRYCMMWRHLAPPPLWVSWDIVRLLTIEKTRKHDAMEYIMYRLIHGSSRVWGFFSHPKNPWRGGGTHIWIDPAHMSYKGIPHPPPPELTPQTNWNPYMVMTTLSSQYDSW